METILLTAVGSASAASLTERYRELGYRVVGCDIYPREWNATSCEVDVFFQVPLATDATAYLAALENAVSQYRVRFLIPLTDVEVDLLCAEKERFNHFGCCVCTPDEACVRLCRNKADAAALLKKMHLCDTIPTRTANGYTPNESDFPLFLKPVSGRSSQGLAIVHNAEEYSAAVASRSDYIVQPYMPGSVFTVETARDCLGNSWALPRKELLRTVNGLGTAVQILPEHPLTAVCKHIADAIDLLGVVNIEFIEHDDRYYFLEINPRFSGGTGFTRLAGVDFAGAQLTCHRGETIGEMPEAKAVTAVRKVEQIITKQ